MESNYQQSPVFKAVEVYPSGQDIVFVCPDEAEAQRAFCEAQFRNLGHQVALDGNKFTIKGFFKERHE